MEFWGYSDHFVFHGPGLIEPCLVLTLCPELTGVNIKKIQISYFICVLPRGKPFQTACWQYPHMPGYGVSDKASRSIYVA